MALLWGAPPILLGAAPLKNFMFPAIINRKIPIDNHIMLLYNYIDIKAYQEWRRNGSCETTATPNCYARKVPIPTVLSER